MFPSPKFILFKGVEILGENLPNFLMKEALGTGLGLNIAFTDFSRNEKHASNLTLYYLLIANRCEVL